jgi:hypothetical protein
LFASHSLMADQINWGGTGSSGSGTGILNNKNGALNSLSFS